MHIGYGCLYLDIQLEEMRTKGYCLIGQDDSNWEKRYPSHSNWRHSNIFRNENISFNINYHRDRNRASRFVLDSYLPNVK